MTQGAGMFSLRPRYAFHSVLEGVPFQIVFKGKTVNFREVFAFCDSCLMPSPLKKVHMSTKLADCCGAPRTFNVQNVFLSAPMSYNLL